MLSSMSPGIGLMGVAPDLDLATSPRGIEKALRPLGAAIVPADRSKQADGRDEEAMVSVIGEDAIALPGRSFEARLLVRQRTLVGVDALAFEVGELSVPRSSDVACAGLS